MLLLNVRVPEFGCGKVVLALIAISASHSKIGHSFSAASGLGMMCST